MSDGLERWQDGGAYEAFIGRWSRKLAPEFLAWARLPEGAKVLDVGCGTGALAAALVEQGAARVVGIDASADFVAEAAARLGGGRASFAVGDALALDFPDGSFDAAVSGLCLNFTKDPSGAVREMARVVRPKGLVALYVWDYAGKMEILRRFWDAAVELDPDRAGPLDEGVRFAVCHPRVLESLAQEAGLGEVAAGHLDLSAVFESLEDYWNPFLGGQGPAPTYLAQLGERERARLRARLEASVLPGEDGRLRLVARAWTVRGLRP